MFAGCRTEDPARTSRELPPIVRVARVEVAALHEWSLVGTIRARYETPLAFRLGGEIRQRLVQAGQRVEAGQLLFELDDHDVVQAVTAAEAQVAAARAEADNAERERRRAAALREQRIVSEQAYDLAATAAAGTRERVRAAEAQLAQARNQLGYTRLTAPNTGVIAEVLAEAGQVVAAGQPVALIALDGPREVEVFLPENRKSDPPFEGVAQLVGDPRKWRAQLREVAASADPLTRTWRARYSLSGETAALALGATVRVYFSSASGELRRVPASAIFENGQGPRVWVVREGRVQPVPVVVRSLDSEHAFVEGDLEPDTLVVALGVHLLEPGQQVRTAP